ncbi:MAG: hypothetical protein MH321_06845 [Leptospiraceae bacterium]|nr:hypothetical protein [Leptospiraceae bacterium]
MNYRFLIFPLLIFLLSCAPEKEQVTDLDLNRVLEKWSKDRIATAISIEEGKKLPSDRELFIEACKVYRLNPEIAFQVLKSKEPKIYKLVQGEI